MKMKDGVPLSSSASPPSSSAGTGTSWPAGSAKSRLCALWCPRPDLMKIVPGGSHGQIVDGYEYGKTGTL